MDKQVLQTALELQSKPELKELMQAVLEAKQRGVNVADITALLNQQQSK